MRDCIIYSEALDDATIEDGISEISFPTSDNLYALYNFSSGSGDMVYDQSGNDNHGTINGATWVEGVPFLEPNHWETAVFAGDHGNM